MADEQPAVTNPDDDKIVSIFGESTALFDFRAMRYLRIKYPHQSTHLIDLEVAIRKEMKRK